MKKRLLKDSWFQMFAAVGGVAYVVSALGTASTRHNSIPSPAPPAASASTPADAAPATRAPGIDEVITPAPRSTSDLATYNGAAGPATRSPLALIAPPSPPAPADPSPPPQMTLTGTGVGNTQGIVGAAAGGMGTLNTLLRGFMGGVPPQTGAPGQPPIASYRRVVPSKKGIFSVGPPGLTGSDTTSLRDAVFSAESGDLILVKPGTYEGSMEVSNKSVRIRGTGSNPIDVKVIWAGPGATISVRNGTLDLEKMWIERRPDSEHPRTVPGGSVYAIASTLSMRNVDLVGFGAATPALIVEQGDKSTQVAVDDCRLSGGGADAVVRGPVKAKFTQVFFASARRPLVAWIDAVLELTDCRFGLDDVEQGEIVAYEGARVTVSGKQKPRINTTRGSDGTAIEESFGAKRMANARSGFSRDIFRRGRATGTLP